MPPGRRGCAWSAAPSPRARRTTGCVPGPGPCPDFLAAAQDEGADAVDADIEEVQRPGRGHGEVPGRVVGVGTAIDHGHPHDPAGVEELDPGAAGQRAVRDAHGRLRQADAAGGGLDPPLRGPYQVAIADGYTVTCAWPIAAAGVA